VIVLITDPRKSDDQLVEMARQACSAIPKGELAILLRDKTRDIDGVLDVAQRLEKIAHEHGQLFFMTRTHLRVAWEIAIDGVHMNEEKPGANARAKLLPGPKVMMSMPAHSDADVTHAISHDVDWVFVSPIFATPNKGAPRGLDAIRNAAKIRADHDSPKIIALGGVDASNAKSCMDAGADGVAVIRAILDAADPFAAARALSDVVLASKKR
jgi:thiamine-phosphate pyrophosphorylase